MGFFAIAINDENNSPKQQPFFTNASGVFTWIGENGIVEQNFKCMEGNAYRKQHLGVCLPASIWLCVMCYFRQDLRRSNDRDYCWIPRIKRRHPYHRIQYESAYDRRYKQRNLLFLGIC